MIVRVGKRTHEEGEDDKTAINPARIRVRKGGSMGMMEGVGIWDGEARAVDGKRRIWGPG